VSKLSEFGPARVQGGPGSVTHNGPYSQDGGRGLDEHGPKTAISTFTGHVFDFHDADTWRYDRTAQLNDIARALANTSRFGGHTMFYSVAEHSLRVSDWLREQGLDERTQLLGLWHDATEAYIGDHPRPLKHLLYVEIDDTHEAMEDYEHGLLQNLLLHFDIMNFTEGECYRNAWAAVKEADYAVYKMERDERPYPAMSGRRAMTPDVVEIHWQLRNKQLRNKLLRNKL